MNILKKFIALLVESLIDNRKLIIAMAILFMACFIGTWIFSSGPVSSSVAQIQNASSSAPPMDPGNSAVDLFINNECGAILTYVGSIFFGIFAVVSIVYNGINMGLFGQLFSQIVPNGGLRYIVYLIPHGIFELTATVLAEGVVYIVRTDGVKKLHIFANMSECIYTASGVYGRDLMTDEEIQGALALARQQVRIIKEGK